MRKCLSPILFLLLISCSSVKSIETDSRERESKMEKLAQSQFQEKYTIKKNETGSHSIVFKKYKKLEDLFATVKFFIFEEESQSIIFQDELNAGSVSWQSDFKVIAISRNLKTNTEKKLTSTYYYNVKTKTIEKPKLH